MPSGLRRQSGVLVVPQLEHCWPEAARGLVRLSSSGFTTGAVAVAGAGTDAGEGTGTVFGVCIISSSTVRAISGVLASAGLMAGIGSRWGVRWAEADGSRLEGEVMAGRAQRHYTGFRKQSTVL